MALATHPRPLADELEAAKNLRDVSNILADFLGAFIESFLDAPLSPLTLTDSFFFSEAQSIPSLPTNPLPLLNLTIANMNNDPAARHAGMLPHNDTTAPKWDESHSRELPQYFKELEYLFADCGIADDMQKKEYAARYVSYDMAETWLGLPDFGNNIIIGNNTPRPYTYQEWKAAVLRLYLGTDASACYNLGDLERLINQTFNSGLATLGRFSDYYRDFQCIARWLLANGKLYHNEECCLFQQGIPMSLWSKIIRCLEITLPDHHPEDPYNVEQVFEGAKWVLKGTDTSTTKTSNGTSGIPLPLPIVNAPAASSPTPNALERLEALLTNGNAQPRQQFANSTCHFYGEIGHTMVQGMCMKLEQMIQQGKIILPSGAMIPNYFGKQPYMEHIEEWHWLNPGQIVTSRLSSNANPDPKQVAMQQSLIHEVMQQNITMGRALSKEEWIKALERELFALRQNANVTPKATPMATPLTSDTSVTSSPPNLTPAPATKPANIGKAPEHTVANKQPPIAKEPVAQPPIHLFSSIPSCYAPPANRNFAASDRTNNGAYRTMPPIYDIEQSKAVFEWVLSTKVTVLVGELCSVLQDIRNQFRTAVTPKQLVGASANMVQDPSDIFKDILPTFTIEEPQFLLGSNANTTNRLTSDKAPFASVNPVKAYIDLLPHGEEPVVLTVAKDSQSLHTVIMLINNKEEVECIHNSGSQIISMSAEIASDIGLSYNPNIVLNMQSANGTMDQSLGLARNIPCTICDIMVYLQIHVLWSPTYDILLRCPFDVLTQSTVMCSYAA
ncbi:hypothetical protein J132_01675 [Termitomyces sp. J132]|nr:hypothetical protein J132_01675 [Termitomyces sp. J132]